MEDDVVASGLVLTVCGTDPQSRRTYDPRSCQATIPQAAHHQGPQLPASSPRLKDSNQEVVRHQETVNLRMSSATGMEWNEVSLRRRWCVGENDARS